VVETTAFKKYLKTNPDTCRKAFRKSHRSSIATEVTSLWGQLKSNYDVDGESVAQGELEKFVQGYKSHLYDPIDFLVVANHPICNIITNDSDFSTDPTVTVYTYRAPRTKI